MGKFGGAFVGASLAGVRGRRAGVLATLMNTRGLTGIVILSVGLQLHILDQSLYSLMIVMAIVTTTMAGPLLHLIYPDGFVLRDIAEAERAALGTVAGHRVLALIEAPETADPLVDIGAALAASREHSQLILCHLVAQEHDTQLEDATGLGGELRETTRTTGTFRRWPTGRRLAGCLRSCCPRSARTSPPSCLGYVAAAEPDTIVLGPGRTIRETLAAEGAVQLVTVLRSMPEAPSAVAALWTPGERGAAAVLVAAQLAVADRLKLVISPPGGRGADLAAELTRDGIAASDGPPPAGAMVVAAAADSGGDAHLTVLAGTRQAGGDLDQWVKDLNRSRLIGQR